MAGEAVADAARLPQLIADIAVLHTLGLRVVLIHGSRPQIDQGLQRGGLAPRYHRGMRITDPGDLPVVMAAISAVRTHVESLLSMGLPGTPMAGSRLRVSSGNFVMARPFGIHDGVDFGLTGAVRKVDAPAIDALLALGHLVLLPNIGYSATGDAFNLESESVACSAAISLGADKLIMLVEEDDSALPRQLSLDEAEAWLGAQQIDEGIGSHVRRAVQACRAGVARVHLIRRVEEGGLLRELFTRDGTGVLVTRETYEGLRRARSEDVGGVLELITPLEASGALVRRSREQLETEIDRFWVIERDGLVIACAALYPHPDAGMGELACLAVHEGYRGGRRGELLLGALEREARRQGLTHIFVLTTQTAHWFLERGFRRADRSALPSSRRELYNLRRNSLVFMKPLGE